MNEDNLQSQIVRWFNNTHCLKTNPNRCCIFSVPNGGFRNALEAMKLKATGLLAGVSDLIVLLPNQCLFIELKQEKGMQSPEQKDFENRVKNLGFDYYLIRSLEDFQKLIEFKINNLHK